MAQIQTQWRQKYGDARETDEKTQGKPSLMLEKVYNKKLFPKLYIMWQCIKVNIMHAYLDVRKYNYGSCEIVELWLSNSQVNNLRR